MKYHDINTRLQSIRTNKNIPIPTLKPDLSNIKEIRDFMNTAKYIKGFELDIASGDNTIDRIKLNGDAQFLLGIKIDVIQEQPENWNFSTFRWIQNNDVVIEDSPIVLYTSQPQYHIYLNEYFTLFRPLNGMDTFKMIVNNPGDKYTLRINLYYI